MLLLLLSLHRYLLIISTPPPPKKKKLAKLRFCFIKNVHEINAKPIAFQRNLPRKFLAKLAFLMVVSQRNLSEFFREIPAKLAVFPVNLSLKIPRNLTFFLQPIRGPMFWTVYVIKVLDLVTFFSLSSHFFSFTTPIMYNLDQSLLKKSKRLNYIGNVKEQTKCLAI